MKKYIAVVDYKAEYKNAYGHFELDAKNIFDAMNEAEKIMDENVYLVRIAEKAGKTERAGGIKQTAYSELLTNRGNGWHNTDEKHSEKAIKWARKEIGIHTFFEIY